MEITGKIIKVLPMQSGAGKNGEWKKQEFIIETPGDYSKKVCIEAMNAMADTVFSIGETVTCHINIESREFNGKWYTTAKLWKLT